MKRAAAKIVPKLLNFEQKQPHMDIAQEMLIDSDLLKKLITGDESWMYGYDNGNQWKHPEKPRPKEAHQVRSNIKILLTFSSIAIAWCILPQGRTVNTEYHLEVMQRLLEAVHQTLTQNCGKTNHGFCIMITH